MGLDWNPGPKAKTGSEEEFKKLWKDILSEGCNNRESKVQRFTEITVSAFDTLNTPTVGIDHSANAWAHKKFPSRADQNLTERQFLERMHGFRVLDLVPSCDGLPRYTNGSPGSYVEAYSFRGQFLRDCTDIIGKELLGSSYVSKLPQETIDHGHNLLARASAFASARQIDLSSISKSENPDSNEFHLDVVLSASRWCLFWGKLGHWLEAYS